MFLPEYREYSTKPLFDEPGVHVDVLSEDIEGIAYNQLSFKLNHNKANLEKWQIISKIEDDLDLLDNLMSKIQQGCYTLDDHSFINTKNVYVQIKKMFKKDIGRFDQIMHKYYAVQHDSFYIRFSLEHIDELYERYEDLIDSKFKDAIKGKDPSWMFVKEDEIDDLYENILKAYEGQIIIGYINKRFLHQCCKNNLLFAIRDEDGSIWAVVVFMFLPELDGPFSVSTFKYPKKNKKGYVFVYEAAIHKYIKHLYKVNCFYAYRTNPLLAKADVMNKELRREINDSYTTSYYLSEPLKFN